MSDANTQAPELSVTQLEDAIQTVHDDGELASRTDLSWSNEASEDLADDGKLGDWDDAAERIQAESGEEAVEPEATPEVEEVVAAESAEPAAEPEVSQTPADAPVVDPVLAKVLETQAAILERLAPKVDEPKEPEIPAEVDYVAIFDQDNQDGDEFRESIFKRLQISTRTPQDYVYARTLLQNKMLERRQAAMEARFEQYLENQKQEMARQQAALTAQTAQTLFTTKLSNYGAVDDDVKEVFQQAVMAGVSAGMAPQAAIDTVFGKLGKLLPPKEAKVAAQPPKPATPVPPARAPKEVSPAQAKLERAVSTAGRGAVRPSPKGKQLTAALAALEGGSGWGPLKD